MEVCQRRNLDQSIFDLLKLNKMLQIPFCPFEITQIFFFWPVRSNELFFVAYYVDFSNCYLVKIILNFLLKVYEVIH